MYKSTNMTYVLLFGIVLFAPSGDHGRDAVGLFCSRLLEEPGSPIRGGAGERETDQMVDVRAVFQQDHTTLDLEKMPNLLKPAKGRFGLIDYEKIFCAHRDESQDIFDLRGIDRTEGGVVLVRPDQHVAGVLPFDAVQDLCGFFQSIYK